MGLIQIAEEYGTKELTETDRMNICDIIWWIKGFNAALPEDSTPDLGYDHLKTLRHVNLFIQDIIKEKQ